jgi:tRNA 2-selenouridine synthase
MTVSIDDFLKLRHEFPVVDVRSEGEFSEGHIPGALNIPLLNNQERVIVGTTYKQHGQLSAIKMGFELVGPRLIEIIESALQTASQHNKILVHCWRGGMRSSNFSRFAEMAGIKTDVLEGGYKSYRQKAIESFNFPYPLLIIGGCTGSGKSELLRELAKAGEQVIDLEKLAHHKGSVFGGLMMPPQPTTEQFQNELFEALLKLNPAKRIWIEDESVAIGKIFLPEPFWKTMKASPIIEIDVPKTIRIDRLVAEYGEADQQEFLSAMEKIVKKLGGQHFNTAKQQLLARDMPSVMDTLLTYYDKAYQNGLSRKSHRIIHRLPWDGKQPEELVKTLISFLEISVDIKPSFHN